MKLLFRTFFIAFAAVILLACNPASDLEPYVPASILSVPLQQLISGKEAAKIVSRMHGKDVAPKETVIGIYGENREVAIIYISQFPTDGKARRYLRKMCRRMGKGSSGFGHHVDFKVDTLDVHFAVGMGQIHYFYAIEDRLYWLAVDPHIARSALAEVLDVKEDQVPTLQDIMKQALQSQMNPEL
ncbi:MAG: hypothetical protein GXO78_04470 [Calditrichaeota bacterium]|nr:hypothetical protein [Calditrichota bacterium]